MGSPVIGEVDGEYDYDSKKHLLNWRLPLVDSSNKDGSMEFSIPGNPADFFPVSVTFFSSKSYCNIEVRVKQYYYAHIMKMNVRVLDLMRLIVFLWVAVNTGPLESDFITVMDSSSER